MNMRMIILMGLLAALASMSPSFAQGDDDVATASRLSQRPVIELPGGDRPAESASDEDANSHGEDTEEKPAQAAPPRKQLAMPVVVSNGKATSNGTANANAHAKAKAEGGGNAVAIAIANAQSTVKKYYHKVVYRDRPAPRAKAAPKAAPAKAAPKQQPASPAPKPWLSDEAMIVIGGIALALIVLVFGAGVLLILL